MAGKRTKYKGLPPRMTVRTYTNSRGETWVGYYYRFPRDKAGKQRVVSLGSDLAEAKRKWADIEDKPSNPAKLAEIYKKYLEWAESESGLSPRTIRDCRQYWRQVEPVYGEVDANDITPGLILPYFNNRTSKISAKKEIKFLSVLFNWARARGMMTMQNPVTGLTRQMKVPTRRTIYVSDADYLLVYKHAHDILKDAMDIAYLTGQRPADVRKMRWDDIVDGAIEITQNKTGKKLRIRIVGELAEVLERIRARGIAGPTILAGKTGIPLSETGTFKRLFNEARDKAEAEANERGIKFTRFQFKDLRAKAATDSDSTANAQKLLGHATEIMTSAYIRGRTGDEVLPIMSKSLLHMAKKKGVTN